MRKMKKNKKLMPIREAEKILLKNAFETKKLRQFYWYTQKIEF